MVGLRLGFSHLREQKFKHSFQDSLNPSAVVEKVKWKLVLTIWSTIPTIQKNNWPPEHYKKY